MSPDQILRINAFLDQATARLDALEKRVDVIVCQVVDGDSPQQIGQLVSVGHPPTWFEFDAAKEVSP